MTIAENATENKAIVERFMNGLEMLRETRDLSLLNQFMTADVTLSVTGFPPELQGRDAFGQAVMMFINAFPDLRITQVSPILAQGNAVVARVCWSGTHLGDFMGIPATGKEVSVTDIHIDRIVDGKIVEHGGVTDMMSLLQQIGVVPMPQ
jgi:steroid delta-isomerase-like uncharacterized protein